MSGKGNADPQSMTRPSLLTAPSAEELALPRGLRRALRDARRSGVLSIKRGPLLNFAASAITLAHPFTGRPALYATVEHRYQAMRATSAVDHDWVASAPDPGEAKARGRSLGARERPDWETFRFAVMREALKVKFSGEPFRTLLLATDDLALQEGRPDPVWGVGEDGSGANWLGRLLEQVRAELRAGR